jgi:hypothetical protein
VVRAVAMRPKQLAQNDAGRRGGSVVEAAFLMPWIAFLFVGVLDFGFYSYAAICTENAARAAAIRTAKDQYSQLLTLACPAAIGELRGLPNMSPGGVPVSTCAANPASITASVPLSVQLTTLNNTTTPKCADCTANAAATSVRAVVTYDTLAMIPIPGVLSGQVRLGRIAEARIQP